jgi:hypothetical protein
MAIIVLAANGAIPHEMTPVSTRFSSKSSSVSNFRYAEIINIPPNNVLRENKMPFFIPEGNEVKEMISQPELLPGQMDVKIFTSNKNQVILKKRKLSLIIQCCSPLTDHHRISQQQTKMWL